MCRKNYILPKDKKLPVHRCLNQLIFMHCQEKTNIFDFFFSYELRHLVNYALKEVAESVALNAKTRYDADVKNPFAINPNLV